MTVFVDTNVLLYAIDPREAVRRHSAGLWLARCWRDSIGRISTQVLHELYANIRRVAPSLDVAGARAIVRRYRAWQPMAVDEATVDQAWELQDRLSMSYWDALMVAAAQMQGCKLLLTEDLQHGQEVGRLRVVNPFRQGPELLDAAE